MLIRVLEDNRVVKINVSKREESRISYYNSGQNYRIVNELPESKFGCWRFEDGKVVLDKACERQKYREWLLEKLAKATDKADGVLRTKLTKKQIERYKMKHKVAMEILGGDYTNQGMIEAEAKKRKIRLEELAKIIVSKGNDAKDATRKVIMDLETVRVVVKDKIGKGNLANLKKIEGIIRKIDNIRTKEDLSKILDKL